MTEDEARDSAERLIATLDMKGHSARFAEAKNQSRFSGEWSVIFDIHSPRGNLIDGPIVVIVSEADGSARLMEGP